MMNYIFPLKSQYFKISKYKKSKKIRILSLVALLSKKKKQKLILNICQLLILLCFENICWNILIEFDVFVASKM